MRARDGAGMMVTVVYVGAEGATSDVVVMPDGACVAQALAASGIIARLGLVEGALGLAIHGQRALADTPLRDGDRIELLRPLQADPKEARKTRARENPLPRRTPRRKRRSP